MPSRPSPVPRSPGSTLSAAVAVTALLAVPPPAGAQDAGDAIAEAVRPAPESLRASATVLGHADGRLVTLREGEGPLVCLADDPAREGFHVACYHESLEPYMARGRELRAEGLETRESIARRWEEIEAGTLPFPDRAALYSLTERPAGEEGARPGGPMALTVIYVRGATAEQLAVPTDPADGIPWLMFPGKPTAHLMIHEPPPEP